MTTNKKSLGARMIAAMEEAVAIEQGVVKPALVQRVALTARSATVDDAPRFDRQKIVHLREALRISQPVFADMLNVSPNTVRAWEQGKREPDGAAVRLLQVAEEHPGWLRTKVHETSKKRA